MSNSKKQPEKCGTCKYLRKGAFNTCQRYPASQEKSENDWCGEYKEKK